MHNVSLVEPGKFILVEWNIRSRRRLPVEMFGSSMAARSSAGFFPTLSTLAPTMDYCRSFFGDSYDL
jgi:hypothetical protein